MSILKSVKIIKHEDGTFAILGLTKMIECKDKHDVCANIEQALWPLLEPMLDNGSSIIIRVAQ